MGSSIHAFDAFDGAVERTQSLLRPFDSGIWWRLAVVAFCAGGFGGLSLNIISLLGPEALAGTGITSSSGYLAILGIFLAVLLVIRCIGAVFHFVLVDGLTVGPVTLFWTFDVRVRKGLRLFLFEALVGGALLGVVALFLSPYDFSLSLESIPLLFEVSPLLLLSVLLLWLVVIVTIDLIVPVMIADDCGVLTGWRTVLGLGAADLRDTLAYLLTRIVLAVAADLIVMVLIFIATIFIIQITFGYAFIATPLAVIAAFLIQVPFLAFFRYYGLLVLGYFSPARDLLTARRG